MILDNVCPDSVHETYLQYVFRFAAKEKIQVVLKGSLANQTATRFSDVDLCLLCDNDQIVENFISGYEDIVMSARTVRPKGILIVVYDDGICVDIDVRKTITQQEKEEGLLFIHQGIDNFVASNIVRVEDMILPSVPNREDWYQLLRLFHRSLIKTLSGKIKEGQSLLQEIKDALLFETKIMWRGEYAADIEEALVYMKNRYPMPEKLYDLLSGLIKQL